MLNFILELLAMCLLSVFSGLYFGEGYNENDLTFVNLFNEMEDSERINAEKRLHLDVLEQRHRLKLATNSYYKDTSINNVYRNFNSTGDVYRENATIVMLVRNWELSGALESMRSLEDRFNNMYQYTWTFLNDVPFTEEFIKATTLMASGKTQYGLVPSEDWDRPSSIDETKFEENLKKATEDGVLYGNSKSYRNMCKFNSGYFFRQELLLDYDYYFRVEPNVEYFCDFQYDPFKVLRENNKKYGFVMSLYEYENTIPTLWNATQEFLNIHPEHLHPNSSIKFITDKEPINGINPAINWKTDYNLCHFWSNFEIGDLNFYRSKPYMDYFQFLEEKGGFYYERWGDAPVHSLGVALLLDKNEIHHFDDIGYRHLPFNTCPTAFSLRYARRCVCDPFSDKNMDLTINSCLFRWWKHGSGKFFLNDY